MTDNEYTPSMGRIRCIYALWEQDDTEGTGQAYADFDRALAAHDRDVAAKALRAFAVSIDLEEIADEWSPGERPVRGDMQWAAGNAASSVQIQAHDRAARIESGEVTL